MSKRWKKELASFCTQSHKLCWNTPWQTTNTYTEVKSKSLPSKANVIKHLTVIQMACLKCIKRQKMFTSTIWKSVTCSAFGVLHKEREVCLISVKFNYWRVIHLCHLNVSSLVPGNRKTLHMLHFTNQARFCAYWFWNVSQYYWEW